MMSRLFDLEFFVLLVLLWLWLYCYGVCMVGLVLEVEDFV